MLSGLLKNFILAFCCFYIFSKILNIRNSKKFYFLSVPFSFVTALGTIFVKMNFPVLTIVTLFLFIFLFCCLLFRRPLNINFSASVIALGISYISFTVSFTCFFPLFYFIFTVSENTVFLDLFSIIAAGLLQFLINLLFFRIKRFKNGIPGFESSLSTDAGVLISVLTLLIASLLNADVEINTFSVIYTVIVLGGLIAFFWWKRHIRNVYIETAQSRNIEMLEEIIEKQKAEIEYLKSDIENLSGIIHKDNKLIPAMELAVKELCSDSDNENAKRLLTELEALAAERKGIVRKYEFSAKQLPATGIVTLDALMNYLLQRAAASNITFDFSVSADMKPLLNLISENDFRTILADLGENAIIAAENSENGQILITIGSESGHYYLDVLDNGISFDTQVILHMGKTRYTTHADTGGSGIGLMTIFELLKKYKASFEMEEFTGNTLFYKRVSVVFDKLSEIRVNSSREEIAFVCSRRNDINLSQPHTASH